MYLDRRVSRTNLMEFGSLKQRVEFKLQDNLDDQQVMIIRFTYLHGSKPYFVCEISQRMELNKIISL